MSARLHNSTFWVFFLLLLSVVRDTAGQESIPNSPGQPQLRTWTDRTGKHQTEAGFVESKDGKVTLKNKDGKTIEVSLKSLSDADQKYVQQYVAGKPQPDPTKATNSTVVEINPSPDTEAKLMSVVVTGVGMDPDKAKYNALSNAIEQTVGVLVDAETLVANDKLVREKVLTYSEGDVTTIKILDQSQKDGLYYVRLQATVAVQKIESRLRSQHVAVREVDGEVFYDNAKRRQVNSKNFTEMLANALRDFGAEKMVKPEIVGKPEVVGQNDQFATMLVKVETQPDMENWKKFRMDMLQLLGNRHRMKSGSFVVQDERGGDRKTGFYHVGLENGYERMKQMDGDAHGHWILLLQGYREGKNADEMRTQWTAYQVDKSIGPVFEELQKQKYRLHVRLLGKTNNVIAEDERMLDERMHSSYCDDPYSSLSHDDDDYRHYYDAYFLSPFLWNKHSYCPAMPAQEFRISVPVNDLPDVARATATIERIKDPQK